MCVALLLLTNQSKQLHSREEINVFRKSSSADKNQISKAGKWSVNDEKIKIIINVI